MTTQATKNYSGRISALIFLASLAYAVMRYNVLGSVPWKDFPFYIMNKAIALSAFILLIINYSLGPLNNLGVKVPERWLSARKVMGMTGFVLVLIHAFMSFLLFNPAVFGKFFEGDGTLTLLAGVSMLTGILAFVVLWGINLSFQTRLRENKAFIQFITSRRFLLAAMLLGAVHIFFMGYEGWLTPAEWHGGMPPISLVAFTFFVVGYVINLMGRK